MAHKGKNRTPKAPRHSGFWRWLWLLSYTGKRPRGSVRDRLEGQAKPSFATPAFTPVFQGEGSAVGLGNLATQHQTNAGAPRLGGKERHKQVGGIGKAGPLVQHPQLQVTIDTFPPDRGSAADFVQARQVGGLENRDTAGWLDPAAGKD